MRMLYFSRRSRNHGSGVDWCSSSTYSHAAAPSALRRIAYSRSDSLSRRRSSMKLARLPLEARPQQFAAHRRRQLCLQQAGRLGFLVLSEYDVEQVIVGFGHFAGQYPVLRCMVR